MTRAADAWHGAWRALQVTPAPGLLAKLESRYREEHRSYHTLQHLEECFTRLAEAESLAERLAELRIALWFHDSVYDTHASDNEAASARWARESLEAAGPPDAAARVAELVLVTRHDAVPAGRDARLLVDVDLSILGADEGRFDEYERQVRREYGWVAEDAFRAGRAQVLESFLARPAIFGTTWFAERLEDRARSNLRRSLRALGA